MKPLRQNLLLLALLSGSAFAAPIVRTNTADALNLTAAWTGGVLPSAAGSVATWNASSTLSNTLGANLTWGGLDVSSASGAVTIAGANGLTFAAGSTMTVSGNNLTIGNKDAGTLNLANITLTGSAKLTFNKTSDTGTTNFNAANALAFNGTLALRGGTPSTTPAAMQGGTGRFWLNSLAGSQAAGTSFALDTGASATDGQDLIIGDWDGTSTNRKLTLSSLSGYGTIRTDAGATGTRNLIVDQATDTVFNGMLLSHASTATPSAVRKIALEKKGIGSLTLAGIVGKETASASTATASDVDLTVTAGTLVLTAANTRTGATTIGSSGTLIVGNGGTNSLLGGSAVTNDGSLVFNYGTGAAVTFAGLISGTGTLTKQGAGLLAVTASSTHTGATTIEQGTLRIGGHLDGSAATVKTGATLATGLQASPGVGYVKALTLESGTSSAFRIGNSAWDTIVVNDTDAFTVSGTHTITPVYQGGLNPGDRREVIDYAGTMNGSFSNFQLSPGTRFQLINDTDNSNIVLEYTGGNVIWKGNLSSTWDLDTTSNWILESDSSVTKYLQGDSVVFDDSAATTTVTLAGTLSPISTTFNNATLDYTLSGAAIAGGSLIKNGAATATLLTDNTYSGATTVNAGKLAIGNGGTTGNLGSGAVSVASGATLEFNRSNVTPGTVDLDYKTTAKLRNVSGAGNIVLTGGAILFSYPGTGTGFTEGSSWSGFSGTLTIKGESEFRTIRNGATAMGTGSIVLGDATTSGILSQIEGNWTWTNPITLTGPSNKILNRSINQAPRTNKLQGVISGSGGLSLEDPAGTMTEPNRGFILTASNTLSGTLTIATGVPVRVGGVPGNTDVTQSGAGSSGSLGTATVVNNGTLTFSRTDAHGVANAISGTGALRVGIPSGAGFGDTSTQVLTYTGTATYTGATTVNNGKLVIDTGASIGGSAVTVQAAGTIGGSGTVGAPLTAAGTIAPGSGVGTLTVSGNTALTGTLAIDVNTTADKLSVTGDLSLAGAFTVTESGAGFTAASYVIAECSGTLTSTLTPPTGYTLTQTGSQLVLGKVAGTAFSNWIDDFTLGGQTAINQDPDSDGVANGLEFVLKGGNPETSGGTQLPTSSDNGTNLIFTFERDDRAKAANSGIVVTVEAGTDLATWPEVFTIGNDTAGSSAGVVISNDGDANPDTVTVTIPKNSATAKFAHLKVTGTP